MIRIFTCLIFSLISITGFSQTFGNEWINFTSGGPLSDQQYYKIKITSEGIYRISSSTLVAAGIPVGVITAQRYQIFYQGSDLPIYITANSTSTLGSNDYIEFYGKGNDGKLDARMYKNDATGLPDTNSIPNSRYSLFTDTAIYYLTWRVDNTNDTARLQQITNTNFTGLTPISYFLKEVDTQYVNDYNFGKTDPFDN